MRKTPLQRRVPPRAPRRAISPASKAHKALVRNVPCLVCGGEPCDPAHLIPRGWTTVGQEDPRAVIALDRQCHRGFDEGRLSLLEHLEPNYRRELAFAVEREGLLRTLHRVTGERWRPVGDDGEDFE